MASNVVDFAKQFAPWLTLGLAVVMGGLRTAWSFIYEHTIGYAITKISLSLTSGRYGALGRLRMAELLGGEKLAQTKGEFHTFANVQKRGFCESS
jgi:hypothetical protein